MWVCSGLAASEFTLLPRCGTTSWTPDREYLFSADGFLHTEKDITQNRQGWNGQSCTFSGRRYPKHCMVSNQTVVAIFQTMTPKDFQQLQHDLEEAMLKLKNARDPNARRDLLVEMRRLLAEADRFNQEPE
jgi:hypothetical protein